MNYGPKTTSTNCYLCYDFADRKSYPGSGTTVFNLGSAAFVNRFGTSFNGTTNGNVTYQSTNGGILYINNSITPGNDATGYDGLVPSNQPKPINRLTCEVWAIIEYPTIGYVTAFGAGAAAWAWGPEATWRCIYSDTQMQFTMSTANNPWGGVSVTVNHTRDNNWHHFVNVYNGSSVLFYIDGILKGSAGGISGAVSTQYNQITTIMRRGGNIFAAGRGYLGSYKEYDYAFTQADVTRNFNANRRRFGI